MAMLMTLAGMAIGRGDGLTKANAIDFDWEQGNVQAAGTRWYRVTLDPLYDEDNPTLALYLTNLTNDSAVVTIDATLAGSEETRTYTIAGKQNKIWSVQAGMLIRMKQTEVYLTLQSDKKVALSAKVYETQDIDEACLNATDLPWNTNKTVNGLLKWHKIDLLNAKTATDQDLQIVYTATAAATVDMAVSMDCPSSGLIERNFALAAGESYTYTMPSAMVAQLVEDEMYLRTSATAAVQVKVQLSPKPATPVIAQQSATEIQLGQRYDLPVGQHLYKVRMDSLRRKKYEPLFTFLNEGTVTANLNRKVALELPAYSVMETDFTVLADNETKVVIEKNVIDGISTDVEWAYFLLSTDQPVSFSARLKHVREGDACKTSVDYDWENGHLQEANTTVWYTIPIGEAKARKQDIIVHGLNRGDEQAIVLAEFAFECPYIDLQTVRRKVAVGAETSKTLNYSMYSMMASDTVYVGVTTDQPIRIWADTVAAEAAAAEDICHDAVDLDMTYGARQGAGDTVWYAVPVAPLRSLTQVPYLSFKNMSTTRDSVAYAMVMNCPNEVAFEDTKIAIKADGTSTKQLARDFVNGIVSDTIYLRVISSEETAVKINMVQEDAGSSCSSAILFNWVSGVDQKAGDKLWYLIDLGAAKAGNQDIEISITNKEQTAAKGLAQLAYDCPCETPQSQTFTLKAGGTRTRLFPHSSLETVGDSLFIRLECATAVHVEARLIDPAPFDTIDCPENVVALNWNTLYTQTTDTAWYYLSHDVLSELLNTELTPQVYIKNLSTTNNVNIKGEVAYHCPVTATMMSKTVSLNAGKTLYKLVERSTAEQVADKDTIMIRVIARQPIEFKAELVDPNTGDDCAHAYLINTPDTLYQQAGHDKWYKLNVADLASTHAMLTFGLKNTGDVSSKVQADLHVSCDSLPLMSQKTTLKPGQQRTKDLSCDVFGGLGYNYLYVHITSAEEVMIWDTIHYPAAITPIDACDSAIAVVPNQLYEQAAGEQWYSVDVKNLRLNTTGDGRLVVYNQGGDTLRAKAEVSWVCPVQYEMTWTKRQVADSLVQEVQRTKINQLGDTIVYVRITADKDLAFRVDFDLSKGDDCMNAIQFDWEHGNVHPGGEYLWYQVRLDSTMIPDSCDLRLHLDNLSRTDSTGVGADLYFDCRDAKIGDMTYTLAPDSSKYKDIDRDLLVSLGWADMLINYNSTNNTHLWVELVTAKQKGIDRDTVRAYVCDGEEYTDSITGVVYTISADPEFSDPHQWNDTVAWRDGTTMRDSITTFIVTPIVAPVLPATAADIAALGAMPLLEQGMQLFVDSSEAQLQAYFAALTAPDSVETMTEIYWAMPKNSRADNPLDTVSYFTKEQTTIKMRLVFKGECGSVIRQDITLPIGDYKYVTTSSVDTICPTPEITGYTSVTDTLPYQVLVADTLGRMRQVDTIRTTETYVWQAPELYTPAELTKSFWPTVANGQSITPANQTQMLLNKFAQDADELTMAIDTLYWEYLAASGYASIDNYVVPTDAWDLSLRYAVVTVCGDTLASDNFDYSLTPCQPYTWDTTVVACESYEWRGEIYTKSCDTTRIFHDALGCDSTLTLHLTIGQPFFYSEEISDCHAVNWHGHLYTESGVYYDSLQTVLGCDSVYELKLTIKGVEGYEIPVVAKYDYWLLMVNRNEIEKQGYTFTPEQVAWYRLNGDVDNRVLDESEWDDELVGTGDYYTTGQRLVGNYYAMITLPGEEENCPVRLLSNVLHEPQAKLAPALRPNMVAPGETLEIVNLDAEKVTTVRVYTLQGVLQSVYTAANIDRLTIEAATQSGYYVVYVETEGAPVALPYVVK